MWTVRISLLLFPQNIRMMMIVTIESEDEVPLSDLQLLLLTFVDLEKTLILIKSENIFAILYIVKLCVCCCLSKSWTHVNVFGDNNTFLSKNH